MAPTVGYWNVRGLAESIRYLLHYKGQDFEDKRYATNSDDWQRDKYQLGLDFPNLPYYIDGSIALTQSNAILRYLARKHGLDGKTEEETMRVELAEQQITDFRTRMIRTCYSPEYEKIKTDFIKSVPSQLKLFSAFLGNRRWLAGDSITYVDFMAYDAFDFHRLLIPAVLKDFPNLQDYMKRFEALPELQNYFKSSIYTRWPILLPDAHFGGKGPEPKKE